MEICFTLQEMRLNILYIWMFELFKMLFKTYYIWNSVKQMLDKLYRGRPKITWLQVIKEDFKNEYPSQNIRDIFKKNYYIMSR